MDIQEWISDHLIVSCPRRNKSDKVRNLFTIVDLSEILGDEIDQSRVIKKFALYAKEKGIGFAWWVIPNKLGVAFYV